MQDAVDMVMTRMQGAAGMASIFGPLLVILGFWMVFFHANMVKVFTSIKSTPGLMYIQAVVNLLIGLTVLNNFNAWTWNLSLFVTLFGWLILIRGLLALFLPQLLLKKVMANKQTSPIKGIIIFVWGLLMCWVAFWM
jgi:hypothetical protein